MERHLTHFPLTPTNERLEPTPIPTPHPSPNHRPNNDGKLQPHQLQLSFAGKRAWLTLRMYTWSETDNGLTWLI